MTDKVKLVKVNVKSKFAINEKGVLTTFEKGIQEVLPEFAEHFYFKLHSDILDEECKEDIKEEVKPKKLNVKKMSNYSPAEFIIRFPEFSDSDVYTTTNIQNWLDLSEKSVNQEIWAELYETGVFLLTAHNLVIFTNNSTTGVVNGNPTLLQSGKSVKGVSVSYNSDTLFKDAGMYNTTKYGMLFYQYLLLMPSVLYIGY